MLMLQTLKLYVPTKWCNEKVNTTDSLAHPSHGKTFKHMTGHANWAWQITQPFELIDESLAASNAMHMQAQCRNVNKHRTVQNSSKVTALLKENDSSFFSILYS